MPGEVISHGGREPKGVDVSEKPRTGWGLAELLDLSRGIQPWPSRLPYQVAFGTASLLLTMIRVRFPYYRKTTM